MPQLQLNQGPQDALLYDNTRSYFTNVGYVRTSNFQVEYRDVASQNSAQLGSTVQYVIPKAADLLGPVDLCVDIKPPDAPGISDSPAIAAGQRAYAQWVDELGFAMIEKVTFSVGSNDIETLTGEQLQLRNELMTSDEQRLGFEHVQKTGRRAFSNRAATITVGTVKVNNANDIAVAGTAVAFNTSTLLTTGDARNGLRPGDTLQSSTGVYFGTVQSVDFSAGAAGTITLTSEGAATTADHEDVLTVKRCSTVACERPGDNQVITDASFQKEVNKDYTRLISYTSYDDAACGTNGGTPMKSGRRKLIIPLSLFFTKHVSQYFPLAAVAGCNDVRISIKFRTEKELVQIMGVGATCTLTEANLWTNDALEASECKLRCHYVHVTGPEATTLMNKEHVRLLKLWQHQHRNFDAVSSKLDMDLSFLHPCTTLLITIRRTDDMNSDVTTGTADAAQKGFFFYHGDGTNPNYDRALKQNGETASKSSVGTVKVDSIQLTLNGQERHPGLDKGIPTDYLQSRLLPMLHSNSNSVQKQLKAMSSTAYTATQLGGGDVADSNAQLYELQGSKNIFVYPFSLNPEGSNPSGAVNFSKVSHAKLTLHLDIPESTNTTSPMSSTMQAAGMGGDKFRVDVYALYYNWLQIKDGRALLSFA